MYRRGKASLIVPTLVDSSDDESWDMAHVHRVSLGVGRGASARAFTRLEYGLLESLNFCLPILNICLMRDADA